MSVGRKAPPGRDPTGPFLRCGRLPAVPGADQLVRRRRRSPALPQPVGGRAVPARSVCRWGVGKSGAQQSYPERSDRERADDSGHLVVPFVYAWAAGKAAKGGWGYSAIGALQRCHAAREHGGCGGTAVALTAFIPPSRPRSACVSGFPLMTPAPRPPGAGRPGQCPSPWRSAPADPGKRRDPHAARGAGAHA